MSSQPLGGHAVKIVGYGVDNGMKYWTVANSWNAEFGEVSTRSRGTHASGTLGGLSGAQVVLWVTLGVT